MKLGMYSIHDAAARYFMLPFTAQTDAQARRMFIQSMGDQFPHRADFILFKVGEFDQETGLVVGDPAPVVVLSGMSIDTALDPRVPAAPLTQEAAE